MSLLGLTNLAMSQHVATLLDDLVAWRIIGNKGTDSHGVSNVQPHGSAWMPIDNSFDRILYWRTAENNSFQLVEYSMSQNLLHNAIELNFDFPTNVFPNVFIVELPDSNEICLMFATHLGIYRWILKHPNSFSTRSSESAHSILADINDNYLSGRSHFHRYDLQMFGQVTCAYSTNYLIYTFHNQMETMILRFDNQINLNSPQLLTYPKRTSTGLFNFLWNSNKSNQTVQNNQPLIAGQKTIMFGVTPLTIILYENGLLKFLSEQLDLVLHEYDLSADWGKTVSKTSKKLFLDYCQYETVADELITRLFIVCDGHELMDLSIYEFQYDRNNHFVFSMYQNKTYSKSLNSVEHSHLPHGSSLTSLTCTNDHISLQIVTAQNRPLLLLVQYENKTNLREEFISLTIDKHSKYVNDDSATIDDIQRQLNTPGEFTVDMIKEALWITFNLNLDDLNQSWSSVTHLLQQIPTILQSLCNQHCDEQAIRNEERVQVLTKFWQNFYSTMIDLRAQALVLLGCAIREERQLILIIHKSAVSFYSTIQHSAMLNSKYSHHVKDIDYLLKTCDEKLLLQIDDAIFNGFNQREQQELTRIQKNLEPIVNNDQIVETLEFMFDKSRNDREPVEMDHSNWTSKVARRILVLLFAQKCDERIEQLERLQKIFALTFRPNDHQNRIASHRMERIQEKVLPYLQDLSNIYQTIMWLSSCPIESSIGSTDDRDILIEHLLRKHHKTRSINQSLIEQILVDHIPQTMSRPSAENWFETLVQSVEQIFTDFWPDNEFLLSYLSSRYQWFILDQYCSKLHWFKPLNSARSFFHALTFYRSGVNMDIGNKYLAAILRDINTDPFLNKLFGKEANPELTFIEWIRAYLKYFGRQQNTPLFLHQALQNTNVNEISALLIRVLFQTSLELKNFDDAFWCIQNTNDYLSQKQYAFEYASTISSLPTDQSVYRFKKLFEYQRDKLGYHDLELLAYIERTSVEQQPIQKSQIFTLYRLYESLKLPLKMAQIMYHYGNVITDVREQTEALQLAFNAINSISSGSDPTDRLFIYPINQEYQCIAPLNDKNSNAHLIGLRECQQRLAVVSAIYALKNDPMTINLQVTDNMYPTQLYGLLAKFHHPQEAKQLSEAFQITHQH